MKRYFARAAFYIIVLGFWGGVVALVLEVGIAAQWALIERNNPYVTAAESDPNWYRVDIKEDAAPVPGDLEIVRLEKDVKDSATPSREDSSLTESYATLDTEDRDALARLGNSIIVAYNAAGLPQAVHGEADLLDTLGLSPHALETLPFEQSPLALDAQEDELLFTRLFEGKKTETKTFTLTLPEGTRTVERLAAPLRDPDGRVSGVLIRMRDISELDLTARQARDADALSNPKWETPYFAYGKNARVGPNLFTNSLGFLDDEVALPKPANTYRVVCIGASTTQEGLESAGTYPNLLEKKLKAWSTGTAYDVVNAGVEGITSSGRAERIFDYLALEPDLIIEYGAVNDVCHGLLPKWEKKASSWPKLLRSRRIFRTLSNRIFLPSEEQIAQDLNDTLFDSLRQIHEQTSKKGVDLAVCSFALPDLANLSSPERDYYERNMRLYWHGQYFNLSTYCKVIAKYNAMLKDFCDERGLIYIPVQEELKGGIEYFGDICHLRPRGIEQKAEIVFNRLIQNLPQ